MEHPLHCSQQMASNALRKLAGAKRSGFPEIKQPQLATLVAESPLGDEWLHELKLDGYRVLVTIKEGAVTLTSRNGNDWTGPFASLAKDIARLPCTSALLDGEAVVLDKAGVSRFQLLQNALGHGGGDDIVFFAFDLLYLDGVDLRGCSLLDRKAALQRLLAKVGGKIRFSDHVLGGGSATHEQACQMNLEGTVSKLAKAPYQSGRSRSWLKVKCLQLQEFVIVGFTDPAGARKGLGALLLGVYENEQLRFCGKVGTGFSTETLQDLFATLKPLEVGKPPVINPLRGALARGVHWVKPAVVAQVAFSEWTADGSVRHPSFQGLREDKAVKDVVRERPKDATAPSAKPSKGRDPVVAGVRLSHPDKVLYPDSGITKMDLALYYERVAPLMLPYVRQRPLTLLRCPDGFQKACFFQKHANRTVPKGIPRVAVRDDANEIYMMVDELPALVSLVQIGVLEFHVWGSRAESLDTPDIIVFDLDPGPEAPWKQTMVTALAVRERLEQLGLASFPRFTGGKGIHVVVPLKPKASWDQAKDFSLALAEEFVRKVPQLFTAKLTKKGREAKILIDYLRNARDATAVASYSSRARPGAPVALPVRWEHVQASKKAPLTPSIKEAPAWLDKLGADPWEGFDRARVPLTDKILAKLGAGS